MSSISTAILSGTAASLISMVAMGFTKPGRQLINDLVDRFKPEDYSGHHRMDMERGQAELRNERRKVRLAQQANRAWIEFKPTVSLRQRQWS